MHKINGLTCLKDLWANLWLTTCSLVLALAAAERRVIRLRNIAILPVLACEPFAPVLASEAVEQPLGPVATVL
jgi:hypothetical protein